VGLVVIPCHATLVGVAWWLTPTHGEVGLAWAHLMGWTVALLANGAIVSRLGLRLPGTPRAPANA